MKKVIWIYLGSFLIFGCTSNLKVLSAKKKMVYPGISTVQPYYKYVLELDLNPNITIDSVLVGKDGKCYKVVHFLIAKSNHSYTTTVDGSGIYFLEADLKKGRQQQVINCNVADGKVVVHYKEDQKNKTIAVNSFIEEREHRR